MKYRNIKIRVNPENSASVQERLFKDGCKWCDGARYAQQESSGYLYVNDLGYINHGIAESHFKEHESEEVTAQQILDPYYDVKIAWANKKPIQYSKDGKRWTDWGFRYLLDIRDDEVKWRVKPQTKAIKQWERKYHANGVVYTMIIDNEDDNKDVDTWIGDAYQAEYEVPND